MIKFDSDQEKKRVLEILEQNMNEEFAATLQYICHRISSKGKNDMLAEAFKSAALDEMAHILFFSDLITKLGGTPRFSDWDIDKSDNLKMMLDQDIRLENKAIERYTDQIKKLKDYPEILSIVEDVLSDEEDHRDIFKSYLEKAE